MHGKRKIRKGIIAQAPAYDAVSIASPHDGDTIFDDDGIVSVQILLTPMAALRSDERIVLYLDGNVVEGAEAGVFVLRDMARGEHSLQAMIVDGGGKTVRQSPVVRFRLWRSSGQGEMSGGSGGGVDVLPEMGRQG